MSIGIYDQDMADYTLVPFNLEAMKLSAYYKKNREIVVLSPQFTPERHEKFFLRKDYEDGNYVRGMTAEKNVDYGGYAFTNGLYVPLAPEIETCRPDPTLYERMEKVIVGNGKANRKKIFSNMMEAEHCRISLDGKTIWEDYPKQFKFLKSARNLMLHDYDLAAIDGGFEEVQKILSRARTDGWATRVGMKFPPIITKGEDLLKWISLKPNSTFYSLRYDGVIDNDAFKEFIGRCREKAVYTQLDYYVTASSANEKEFLDKYIRKIFHQVVKSRRYRVFFTLKYEENFFFDNRWEKVIDLFNFYHNSLRFQPQSYYCKKISKDTLFNFAKASYDELPKYYHDLMTKQDIRELFRFVREKNPALFKDFYEFNINSMEEV